MNGSCDWIVRSALLLLTDQVSHSIWLALVAFLDKEMIVSVGNVLNGERFRYRLLRLPAVGHLNFLNVPLLTTV